MTDRARRRHVDPELAEILAEVRAGELEALDRLEVEQCTPGPPPPAPHEQVGAYLRFVAGRRPRRRHRLSGLDDLDPPGP